MQEREVVGRSRQVSDRLPGVGQRGGHDIDGGAEHRVRGGRVERSAHPRFEGAVGA